MRKNSRLSRENRERVGPQCFHYQKRVLKCIEMLNVFKKINESHCQLQLIQGIIQGNGAKVYKVFQLFLLSVNAFETLEKKPSKEVEYQYHHLHFPTKIIM